MRAMIRIPAICFGLLAAAPSATAATCTWSGGGATGAWSSAANWTGCGGVPPQDGDDLVFPDGAARTANDNDLVKLAVHHLQVDGLNYNITGLGISLSTGLSANIPAGGITDKSPQFAPNISLVNPQIFDSGGSRAIVLKGVINLNGHHLIIDTGAAAPVNISGSITGAGGIDKNGTGSLFLSGPASTYTGTTAINGGKVFARSNTALGAAGPGNDTTVASGASLLIGANSSLPESVALAGLGSGGAGALGNETGDNELSGDVFLDNIAAPTIANAVADSTLTLSGMLNGFGTLTKSGVGTLRLSNINTNSGTTVVNGGTVDVTGQVGFVTVNNGGTLAGDGIAGAIVLKSGGVVSPGGRPGTLDSDSLAWEPGGSLTLELGPTAALSDRLALTDSLPIGGDGMYAVEFRDGATPPQPGVTYTLVTFATTNFIAGDFTFSYAGTGPDTSMSGAFAVTPTELQFTPSAVVSDLVFRNGVE